MKIIYASCLCESEYFSRLFEKSLHIPGQQVQKYHRLIVEGMAKNGVEISVISAPPIARNNYSGKFVNGNRLFKDGVDYRHLPVVNIPVLKNLFTFICSFFVFLKALNKDTALICDVLNVTIALSARIAAKIRKAQAIGIVTDIPAMQSEKDTIDSKIDKKLIDSFDSYVLLADAMKKLIKCENKKCVLAEGQVDVEMQAKDNKLEEKYNKKICIYAGGLDRIYGIDYLTEAFIAAQIPDAELHIYGNGDYEAELEKISDEYDNIKFFGVKPNEYVVSEQIKATLLINPRPSGSEFTKYSFPSKNMEYMVSGTPVLTTKLPGMPEEYYPYVYLIQRETADGLAQELKHILSKSSYELHNKGMEAKSWVLENKNNIIQSRKILEMIQSC